MIKNLILIVFLCTTAINAKEIKLFGMVKSDISSSAMINSQDDGKIIHKYYTRGQYVKKGFVLAVIEPKKAEVLNGIGGYKINNIKIKSPISGYVVDDFIFNGSVVNNGSKITKIVSNKNRYLSIQVPNSLRDDIFKNKEIKLIYNNEKITTKIDKIIPITNTLNNTFEAVAPIKNKNLYIGSVCEVIIKTKEK